MNFQLLKKTRIPILSILFCFLLFDMRAQDISFDELLEMDLERMVEIQSGGRGDVGSFGYRLGTGDAKTQLHGYVTNEYIKEQNGVGTFDNHYYNLLAGTKLGEKIFAEIQLEYEHGGEVIEIRYAQVDYKVSDALIFRTGKFLVPINTFNEYLYPEYINKTISRSFINRNITPSAWAEVGIQARGNFKLSEKMNGFYSVFMVNGLEGDEGGDIRGMRGNNRDKNDDNKALGGRVGVSSNGFEFGTGYYNGVYTPEDGHRLQILAIDFGYIKSGFTLRGEYNLGSLETSDETINRNGASLAASYIIANKVEPVLRYDFMNWDDPADETKDKNRIYLGANYLISNTMNVKVGYEIINNSGADVEDNVFAVQLALGF